MFKGGVYDWQKEGDLTESPCRRSLVHYRICQAVKGCVVAAAAVVAATAFFFTNEMPPAPVDDALSSSLPAFTTSQFSLAPVATFAEPQLATRSVAR